MSERIPKGDMILMNNNYFKIVYTFETGQLSTFLMNTGVAVCCTTSVFIKTIRELGGDVECFTFLEYRMNVDDVLNVLKKLDEYIRSPDNKDQGTIRRKEGIIGVIGEYARSWN